MNIVTELRPRVEQEMTNTGIGLSGLPAEETLIDEAALFVQHAFSSMNAAEKWIDIGKEMKRLNHELARRSKHDKGHIGWAKAFNKKGRFPFSRPVADMLIAIHEFHVVTKVTSTNLPASWKALFAMTKLPTQELRAMLENGTITPATTGREIISIVKKVHPPEKKEKKELTAEEFVDSVIPKCKKFARAKQIDIVLSMLGSLGITTKELFHG